MSQLSAAQIHARYERGMIVRNTMILELAQCGADHPPAESAGALPADVLDELREKASDLDAAEQTIILRFGSFTRGYDQEAAQREDKRRYVAGLRNWRAYFDRVEGESVAPPGLAE